jgi:hypothetical protein
MNGTRHSEVQTVRIPEEVERPAAAGQCPAVRDR